MVRVTHSSIPIDIGTNHRSSSAPPNLTHSRTSAARPYGLRRILSHLLQRVLVVCLIVCLTFSSMPEAWAQVQPQLLKQATDTSAAESMTAEEIAGLNDPFFNLLLKDHLDTQTVNGISQRLRPDRQETFVVHERIVDNSPTVGGGSPASRRSIITFDGNTDGEELNRNVMLSVFFNSESFPSVPDIEAMAWDEGNGKFNYYKLNEARGEAAPSWKFRGDSKGADLLSASAREGTCMACHIDGGMVMKEFKAPWNNWHSRNFQAEYLFPGARDQWPVVDATNSPLKDGPAGAVSLESTTQSANQRLNERRMAGMKNGDRVTDAKRLLKPLFVTTEFNLMSSFETAGNHPFGNGRPSNNKIFLPISFFLNSDLMGGIGVETFQFNEFTDLDTEEYQAVVNRGKTRLGNQDGDTHFAWLTPEASNIDTIYVEKLINDGVVPESFVAAVLAVDLETPVLSGDRAALWNADDILPTEFRTGRNNDLTSQTIRNLERLNPSSDSPEGQFLEALQSPDPIRFLQSKVDQYIQREQRRFDSREVRSEEIGRLYRKLLVERDKVEGDAVLSHLIESPLLFPKGDIAALPETVVDPAPLDRPTLREGDQGDAVEDLQRLLQRQSFLNGPIDGDFGPGTEQAVISAQRQFGLEADGIVGPATWEALEGTTNPQPPIDLPVLRVGDRGDDVAFLQQLLVDQGFLFGPVDGDFGGLTRAAVIRAQRRFGLDPDGVVGPATWAVLGA